MSARDEAIGRLAKATKEAAGDWGWRGGKPGEITGNEFVDFVKENAPYVRGASIDETYANAVRMAELDNALGDYDSYESFMDTVRQVKNQLSKSKHKALVPYQTSDSLTENDVAVMTAFKQLEDLDVPRKWTGKIVAAIEEAPADLDRLLPNVQEEMFLTNDDYIGEVLKNVANYMRPMTEDQRGAFLQLLYRWTGTMEQAANAAKKLYRR